MNNQAYGRNGQKSPTVRLCQGDPLCCRKLKPLTEFSPSALKCVCKMCNKKIIERNRQTKIDNNLDGYILEKIKSQVSRVSLFSANLKCSEEFFYAWIKFQSKDPFNEHFDHVIPIHYFKQFSDASLYMLISDSWVNIMPLNATENLKKGTKVDFSLFKKQIDKACAFIRQDFKHRYDPEMKEYLTTLHAQFNRMVDYQKSIVFC